MKSIINHPLPVYYVILLITILFSCKTDVSDISSDPIQAMYKFNVHDQMFDSDWRFYKGNAENAEQTDFDDASWRELDLPHDWSIEDLEPSGENYEGIDPKPVGPFDPESPGDISTGHTIGGTGWYRKHFKLAPQDMGKIVKITFDGVYMNADVWINGQHLGNHPYGYTAFTLDITPFLQWDGSANVLVVRVVNEGRNSRWYSGSGIYRHVWLSLTDPLHLDRWGLFITTPEISEEVSKIRLEASILNYYDHSVEFNIETKIIDPAGDLVANQMQSYESHSAGSETFIQDIIIHNPTLWSIDQPRLYLAQVSIILNGREVDQLSSTFGVRSIEFSTSEGFQLNGQTVLIKGGNMHHDNGPLGAAAIDRAEYRRVELMKSYGFNAIRTSHNPPSRQFLDACDQLGMLVMDEAFDQWRRPKNPNDYHRYFNEWWERDIEAMVLRDRNHPSVIIWSIGNEINERADSLGLFLTKVLKEKIRSLDSTRPVTAAICGFWDHPGRTWDETAAAFELLDIASYNYQWQQYEPDHETFPDRIILGTESVASEIYENWQLVKRYPWVIGDFVWTGMDYLGEAGIGNALLDGETKTWPWFNANCGDIDLCGFKKSQSYYRDVVWGLSSLEMAVHVPVPDGRKEIVSFWGWPNEEHHWNWSGQEGKMMQVSVYSSCDSVILELNGERYARVDFYDTMNYKSKVNIRYEPGELTAKGYSNGSIEEVKSLKTTGRPHAIRMTADRKNIRADRNDLAFITVEVIDASGNLVPDDASWIRFDIQGEGQLAGVGNGNPTDIKSFQKPECKVFKGRCVLILRPKDKSSGLIRLIASAEHLESSIVDIVLQN